MLRPNIQSYDPSIRAGGIPVTRHLRVLGTLAASSSNILDTLDWPGCLLPNDSGHVARITNVLVRLNSMGTASAGSFTWQLKDTVSGVIVATGSFAFNATVLRQNVDPRIAQKGFPQKAADSLGLLITALPTNSVAPSDLLVEVTANVFGVGG